MSFIYKKSIQHFQNPNGRSQTAFSIMKDKNGTIQKINGVGNGETFHIKETVAKNLTGNRTKFAVHEKVYKIKTSNIKNLLNESRSKSSNKVKSSPKKIVPTSTLKKVESKSTLKKLEPISTLKKKISKVKSKSELKKKVKKVKSKSNLNKKVKKVSSKSTLKKKVQ